MRGYVALIFFFLSSITFAGASDTDSLFYTSHVFDNRIKTVQLYKDGWNLSYPIIKLNSDEKLLLNFDLLGDQPESYYYTLIHCDKDWNKSDIFPNDYMTGFTENPMEDYANSFNTTVSYIHYKLSFPNDKVGIILSGNYILEVYPSGKPEEPAITQRFIVTEDAARINVTAHRPLMTKDNNTISRSILMLITQALKLMIRTETCLLLFFRTEDGTMPKETSSLIFMEIMNLNTIHCLIKIFFRAEMNSVILILKA